MSYVFCRQSTLSRQRGDFRRWLGWWWHLNSSEIELKYAFFKKVKLAVLLEQGKSLLPWGEKNISSVKEQRCVLNLKPLKIQPLTEDSVSVLNVRQDLTAFEDHKHSMTSNSIEKRWMGYVKNFIKMCNQLKS